MYFECTIKYWDDDTESSQPRRKKFTPSIACSATNYTDAEAIATEYAMMTLEIDDFQITPIKEMNVDSIHFSPSQEGKWFKTFCEFLTENRNGNPKINKINFLVQANDQKEAYESTLLILRESFGNNSSIKKIEETKIEAYIV